MPGQRLDPQQRVGGVDPVGGEDAAGEQRRHAGLHLGDFFGAVERLEPDARRRPLVQARLRRAQPRGCFIELKLALAADQVLGARVGQKPVQCGRRMPHHRRLRITRSGIAVGHRGAQEPHQPRQDLRCVGGRDAQRAQRVEQPFRRLPDDPRRGQRDDVGKGEGPGIPARRARRHARAVEQCHLVTLPQQAMGGGHADHARTYDGNAHSAASGQKLAERDASSRPDVDNSNTNCDSGVSGR